ncbi:histidine kinase [Paracidovorax avenae]|uniref:PAS domain S-box protein n=1 Tax=Paracidovorax avenae TaxID=80867 RepID=UPI000D16D067|nr:PAS domain S-box protein [Paracidovorax avenae]AVS81653.1 histidine kinase [Paracidovorax avenae]AVS90598.1 histidine kinase [Paracidovorax avenae]AVS99383.1 histidine kinase [Paracidovorax avenae]AVT06367.1 histidine kinase [Paracidovorax avenae]AVT16787.1 histidine kinase [Paracidovorax avenae]
MDEITPGPAEEAEAGAANGCATPGGAGLPVVGLGGSAGAIQALRDFFAAMPASPGMAFVVVLHLSPDHESMLAELLQRATKLRVLQVTGAVTMEVDTVYVVPPRKILEVHDGAIALAPLPPDRQQHVAVDLLFRTLADSHGTRATAIVLSGADGDGAIGIKRIKERGGLTIAQDPGEAYASGMPGSAIATGMIDWVLPAAQMAARVMEYHRMAPRLHLAPPHGTEPPASGGDAADDEAALREVLALLRHRTGRDFGDYKRATVVRRVGRRMQVNGIGTMSGYLDCLRTRPGESGALLQDLLISVTNFFRDPVAFAALESHLPQLFQGKTGADTLRVWVAGCATGEEAYSIAMLLAEYARTLDTAPVLQIFATDLDDAAIRAARDGFYPAAIESDVSAERLRRFFVRERGGYRVRRELRESVLFAVHDLLRDSPFSRLDLISCRNLLIYLNREAQHRVLDTFHFALLPGKLLFLGSAESVDDGDTRFSVIDKLHRLYGHQTSAHPDLLRPGGLAPAAAALHAQHAAHQGPVVHAGAMVPYFADTERPPAQAAGEKALPWGEVHLRLLEQLAPPSILVDGEQNILHMSPSAGRFLVFHGGEPSRNLMRLIHPALRIELRAALYRAGRTGQPMRLAATPVDAAGGRVRVAPEVRPVPELGPGLSLVLLQMLPELPAVHHLAAEVPQDTAAEQLDRELELLNAQLRSTIEQYEASTEELRASNEELQAMNEELRSATEELETNREELQSINEELTTVNHELKSKVDELGHANSDMQNLMDATAIATVFLDRDLRITRFTPSAVTLFNLIATDVGRPLSHLRTQLQYPELSEDARRVLERLALVEREVGASDGNWYLVRMLPYRTLDDRIAGVVLTFVDISERKQGQEALRRSEDRFSAIVNQAVVGVVQTELDGHITFVNRHYSHMLGYGHDELIGTQLLDLIHPADRQLSAHLMRRLAEHGEPFHIEKRCLRKDGSTLWLHNSVSYLADAHGGPTASIVVCNDISERKRAENALRESTERLRLVIENAVEYAIFSTDLDRRITTWNSGAERILGYSENEAVGQLADMIFTPEDRAAGAPLSETSTALATGGALDDRLHQRKDGSRFWASGALMPMHDDADTVVGFVKILRDQSDQRASQQALEQSRADLLKALRENEEARAALQAADATKDRFLAVLSHELRNPLASIAGASAVLATEGAAPGDRDQAARIVQRQARAMAVLLDDLMDLSRLRLGRMVLQQREVPLDEIVEAALEATLGAIRAAGHDFVQELPADTVMLLADPVRIAQVLANLLSNAAKYTPDHGRIRLSAWTEGGSIYLRVEDNGIGMDPETVDDMFTMFSQSPDAGMRHTQGLGIGLALVRNIVEMHQGTVRGESAGPGQGSRFTVQLPLPAQRSADGAARAQAPDEGVSASAPVPSVLLADDNVDVTWSISHLLEGCTVATAADGHEALRKARELGPDVAVLDLGMPGLDGISVARALRADPAGARMLLVAATGWGQDHNREQAREAGFDAYMVKPLDVRELQRLIQAHMRSRG